jgi:alkylated DNA repair dioxygenase AlkB
MSLLDELFANRNKKKLAKKMAKEASSPATRADLDKLRIELKETPEEKEDLAIYDKWMSMTMKERKEKWIYLSINQRNRLSRIVNERKAVIK